jgi:hypothetical protein
MCLILHPLANAQKSVGWYYDFKLFALEFFQLAGFVGFTQKGYGV